MAKFTTFLMFDGKAEEAMDFYISLFPDSDIKTIARYGQDGPGREGTVKHAVFILQGQEFMCLDTVTTHAFTFTPAISIFIACKTEREIDELFDKLSAKGKVLMPLGPYPFSKKFGWLEDRYGVSWQLNLEQ